MKRRGIAIPEPVTRPILRDRQVIPADLHIIDKKQRIVPLKLKRIQEHLLNNLTGRDLVVKSRQPGISTAIEAYLFCEAVNKTARIGVMAHDEETTQKMRDMQQLFFDELPPDLKPERAINNATRVYYPRTKSMIYIGTAGNTSRGRGGTYSHFHGSEVPQWKNADYLLAGVLQGVPMDGQIILEGTANGALGWFYNEVNLALRGDSVFKVHFYPWFWDEDCFIADVDTLDYTGEEAALVHAHGLTPGQIAWRRYKRKELGRLFDQEYPETIEGAFLSSGAQVFGDFGVYTPAADAKPIAGHDYSGGLDWGQDQNFTSFSIIDATANREVYLNRWRKMAWASMRAEIIDACRYWNVTRVTAEKNAASSNIEDLDADIYAAKLSISLSSFTMTHKKKGELINHFNRALHEEGLELIDSPYGNAEMRSLTTKQNESGLWVYVQPLDDDGGHGDTLIARLLAWRGAMNIIPESY